MSNSAAVASPGTDRVFPALLKHWRGGRGMSQLDLALSADVSARHISFLETGRSGPSVEMVRLLAEALDIPLRSRNDLLRAAGFAGEYPEPDISTLLGGQLGAAVDTMGAHHEPYPMMVTDGHYNVVRANVAGTRILQLVGVELPDKSGDEEVNLLRMMFAPDVQPMFANWDAVGGDVLRRLQREVLQRPHDADLAALFDELLASSAVPAVWRQPDPTTGGDPTLVLRFQFGDQSLAFLTTMTQFNAPQSVTLDELRIESWFPLDSETDAACVALLGSPGVS